MKIISLTANPLELLDLLKNNDRKAQSEAYYRYAPQMLGVCRRYIRDVQQAEHVMVGGFVKVFQQLDRFENKGSFEGWIRRIMVNESLSFLRSQREMLFLEECRFSEVEEAEADCEADFTLEELEGFIAQLPLGMQTVFNLFVVEGYKHVEIAELLGIQAGTSKSQLAHARKILQQQLITKNRVRWKSGEK
ncbi:RNA polymerase sigma factor [Flavobacterium sp. JP2137]|uniref:RNA polymerase sigma factor n=1 Tax=Flavobacterium sp. JP2137 TaxID=3414510 RepID=UPI003D3002F8